MASDEVKKTVRYSHACQYWSVPAKTKIIVAITANNHRSPLKALLFSSLVARQLAIHTLDAPRKPASRHACKSQGFCTQI